MTIAEAVVPQTWRRSSINNLGVEVLLILIGSAAVSASALVRIDLPFTPVPITGQTFGVLLVGAVLGWKRGAAALLAYLGEGAIGLPVFAGGTCCPTTLLGPTGGYLFSFPIAAGLVGWLAERGWDRKVPTTALAMILGNVVIYAVGLSWLARFVPINKVFELGMLPFIPGDIIKLILATLALPSAWKLINNVRGADSGR